MSPRKVMMVVASTDKTVPSTYAGQLEPNYYCRGWNGKRSAKGSTDVGKYCKARAGKGTDHQGVGRCKHHGGTNQNDDAMKHGRYSKIGSQELRTAIEEAAKDERPLDMLPTLAKAKGILDHAIAEFGGEESEIALSDLTRAADTISKITFRIEQQRGMVASDRVRLFMEQLRMTIEEVVLDERVREKLYARIDAIRA